jgi:hypothetical protein
MFRANSNPIIKASYSVELFETVEVKVNEYGIMSSLGVTKTTPAPTPDRRHAPSKYILDVELTTDVVNTS